MPSLTVETEISAPVDLVFDLARDVGAHCATAAFTQERAVAGVIEGRLALGDEVRFEAVHLGFRQRLAARIVEFERPVRFVDEMLTGAFESLRHEHAFQAVARGTVMRDTLTWRSPLGLLGRLADRLVVARHLGSFLRRRNANLKHLAEAAVAVAAQPVIPP